MDESIYSDFDEGFKTIGEILLIAGAAVGVVICFVCGLLTISWT